MTPWTTAQQAPLSMGFSRQEHWSGLLCSPPGDLPNPGIESRSPALQADSLSSESPGKPTNTGVDSFSLLQLIFLTQVSNPGLLHCRQILYHLSHLGSHWLVTHNRMPPASAPEPSQLVFPCFTDQLKTTVHPHICL